MVVKIIGGYEIKFSIQENDANMICSVEREGKDVRFSYKFYEKNKEYLDTFVNIQDFVKEPQDRDEQDRVSINLNTGKTNTTDSKKLLEASRLLLGKVDGSVDGLVLKTIISMAKNKIVNCDEVCKKLQSEIEKITLLRKNIFEIFGQDSENLTQVDDKLTELKNAQNQRYEELIKSL